MTDKDIVKDLVKEVLLENPDLTRQRSIAADRARMEAYMREIATPAPRSPVEPYDAPVSQVDVEMPVRTVFFNDPAPGAESSGAGAPPLAFVYLDAMVCDDMDMDVLVRLMIAPPA